MLKTQKRSEGKRDPAKIKIDFLKEGRLNRFMPSVMNSNAHYHTKFVKISFSDLS